MPLLALAPVVLLAAAPWRRLPLLPEAASLVALALAAAGLGIGTPSAFVRADAVSATLGLLVAFIAWVVLRHARRQMTGEPRAARFHALLLAAVAAVLVLVQAANLGLVVAAFVAVGAVLRQLLLFYPDRPEARRAAAKFSTVWGLGDLALILAAGLTWAERGTLDIATLNAQGMPGGAIALVVLAAALKTAAFPLHGWVTEVMEAPTPVSALLHAGVINSGGVLLLTLAGAVQQSPLAMAALVAIGGLTALFGAVVMLTQSAVKTALAWSTVAQMGFLLMQCGLGLWPLALLHILAHSLYKAHAFLSSGTAVRAVVATTRPGPVAVPSAGAVLRSLALALALYLAVAAGVAALGLHKSPQALALGAMLIFGTTYLVAQGLADAAPSALTWRLLGAALLATLAYFGFQILAEATWGPALPPPPQAGPLEWTLIALAVLSFGLIAWAQTLFPLWAHHPSTAGLRVHLANGLYLNAALDRLIGGFRAPNT